MKLTYRITLYSSIAILVLLTIWAFSFYFIMMNEINDETDDSLEDYSEHIILRALAGEELPSMDNGTNNSYYIEEVSEAYAAQHQGISYRDEMIYIKQKKETEPTRILTTIFQNKEDKYYELTVLIPTIEKEDLRKTIMWWIVILYVILLLAIITVNTFVFYRSLRPLYVLLEWLDSFTIGKKIAPLTNETNVTEFKTLNEVAIRSVKRNVEIYELQKQFIGNASHELQTPLAVCKNRLEILANDPDLKESQLEQIIKTQETLSHLIKLNKTLLLLTKIENKQFTESTKIEVNQIVKILIADYNEIYTYKNIHISFSEEETMLLNMNHELAFILFGNLLKNAYAHNLNEGQLIIQIHKNEIVIANSGDTQPLNPKDIFNRFYQKSKKQGSTGLGLSIVDAICKLYNIQITYTFKDELHSFTLI